MKEEADIPDLEQDSALPTQGMPESLTEIITEEVTYGTVVSEPEDSIEPPHEMIRGMGSSILNGASSVPSTHPSTFYIILFFFRYCASGLQT